MKRIFLFGLALAMSNGVALADTLPSPEAARDAIGKMMEKISESDLDGAFQIMSKYANINKEGVSELTAKTRNVMAQNGQNFGKNIGHEYVKDEFFGKSLYRVVELEKLEKAGIVWTFYLYKNSEGWTIQNMNYESNIGTAFK